MVSPDHKVSSNTASLETFSMGPSVWRPMSPMGGRLYKKAVELRAGVKGVFKVSLDGRVLFDKAEVGRMPNPGEMVDAMAKQLGPRLKWRKTH